MNELQPIFMDNEWFKVITYPDGCYQVRILPEHIETVKRANLITLYGDRPSEGGVMRTCLAVNAICRLKRDSGEDWKLALAWPFLPYSRADREFCAGDCCGLEAFGHMLFMCDHANLFTLDVHNKEAFSNYINWGINVPAEPLILEAIQDFARGADEINVLFPDEGAASRYLIPDAFGCNRNIVGINKYYGIKRRDSATGNIGKVEVPDMDMSLPCLVIDDICDGGATFIQVADGFTRRGISILSPLGLYVTHGIFSKGVVNLQKYYSRIYTSNSLWARDTPYFKVLDGRKLINDAIVKHFRENW